MKPINLNISDPINTKRFAKEQARRKHPRPSRTVRELALERLKQIEEYGDVPFVPARLPVAGHTT